jgi:DNA sulfur modification protein DndB
MTELDLAAGTHIKGIKLDDHTFFVSTSFQQLRVLTRNPEVLQMTSKSGEDDPDIMGERVIHEMIQRVLAGGKKKNVEAYRDYISEVVTRQRVGVLPPMHLWSEQAREIVTMGSSVYLLVPSGEHLLAIDGETQLTAHHQLARSADPNTKAMHLQWPLSAVVHHGIDTETAGQYFHDLNVLSIRPNVSLGLGMNTQDPVMGIVNSIESSPVLRGRVERQARQLPRKSEKLTTITNLRQMVITVARGINGIQYGARPMPTDDVDIAELKTVATEWIVDYFTAFREKIGDRETALAGAGPVLAAVGALGHRLMTTPAEERAGLRARMLDDLRTVDWTKGDNWNGIAGGYTARGVFSVKGTKEVAYGVHNALNDPLSPGYSQVRGRRATAKAVAGDQLRAEGNPEAPAARPQNARQDVAQQDRQPDGRTDLHRVAGLPWDDSGRDF